MRIKMRESDSYIASVFLCSVDLYPYHQQGGMLSAGIDLSLSIAVTLLYKICAQILKLKAKIPNLELSKSLYERQIFCTLVNNISFYYFEKHSFR